MPNKPVALVTGANQGIGLQIAKDLVPHGFTVWSDRAVSRRVRRPQKASARMPKRGHLEHQQKARPVGRGIFEDHTSQRRLTR